MNSRSAITDKTIPIIQLNNTIDFEHELLLTEEITTEEITKAAELLNQQKIFEQNIITRTRTSVNKILIKNNIILSIKKPTGFNEAIKEVFQRKGTFNIFDENNILTFKKSNILSCLYNKNIKDHLLENMELDNSSGKKNNNLAIIKNGNNIPIEINNDIIKLLPNYNLDTFVLEIPITAKNNILKNILKKANKNEQTSKTTVNYNFKFGVFFDIERLDKFPINFMWIDNSSKESTNRLLTSISKQEILVTGITDLFLKNCFNGTYNKLYIIFS
jgi:hypothetical protein